MIALLSKLAPGARPGVCWCVQVDSPPASSASPPKPSLRLSVALGDPRLEDQVWAALRACEVVDSPVAKVLVDKLLGASIGHRGPEWVLRLFFERAVDGWEREAGRPLASSSDVRACCARVLSENAAVAASCHVAALQPFVSVSSGVWLWVQRRVMQSSYDEWPFGEPPRPERPAAGWSRCPTSRGGIHAFHCHAPPTTREDSDQLLDIFTPIILEGLKRDLACDTEGLLYHGTTACSAVNIVSHGIDVSKCRGACDFGTAFYLGESLSEAVDWAHRVSTGLVRVGQPLSAVLVYRWGCERTDEEVVHEFRAPTEEWSQFVRYNRVHPRLSEEEKTAVEAAPCCDSVVVVGPQATTPDRDTSTWDVVVDRGFMQVAVCKRPMARRWDRTLVAVVFLSVVEGLETSAGGGEGAAASVAACDALPGECAAASVAGDGGGSEGVCSSQRWW